MDGMRDEMKDLKRHVREQAEEARSYVFKSGDSLSKITEGFLGDPDRWREIFEANKDTIDDQDAIKAGQELKMPS